MSHNETTSFLLSYLAYPALLSGLGLGLGLGVGFLYRVFVDEVLNKGKPKDTDIANMPKYLRPIFMAGLLGFLAANVGVCMYIDWKATILPVAALSWYLGKDFFANLLRK